jgi:hypothetical protein
MGCPTLLLDQSLGWNPSTINSNQTVTISLSSAVPVGATIAFLNVGIGTNAPAGAAVDSADSSSGTNLYATVRTQVAGQYANGLMLAPIDANRNIYISNKSSSSFSLWVWLLAYC